MSKRKRHPDTGIPVDPPKPKRDWIDDALTGADNRARSLFDRNTALRNDLHELVLRAAEAEIEVSRKHLRRVLLKRHNVRFCEATLTRYLNDEAPEEIRKAWDATRRSCGLGR